jgi:hypothetical protein
VTVVWLLLGWLAACALVTFGWCLRARMDGRAGGTVDLTVAAVRGELDRPRRDG